MSPSVLNRRLAELREFGLVASGSGGYALTPAGQALAPLLAELDGWARRWVRRPA